MVYEKESLQGGATHTYWSTLFEMLWHSQQPGGQQLGGRAWFEYNKRMKIYNLSLKNTGNSNKKMP
jgi:hypothetical protein